MKLKLLIVDDDVGYCNTLEQALGSEYTVCAAYDAETAREKLKSDTAIVLMDVRLQGDREERDGLNLLTSFRSIHPEVPVVMMTAYADIDLAVEAMRLGAVDFISKARTDLRELRKVLAKAMSHARLQRKTAVLEEDLRRIEPWKMIGDHPALKQMSELVGLAAKDSLCTVMIRGETGSGKELVARAIHSRGPRREMPFVAVSIASLAPELVSAALFGSVKGAYTDARESRMGYIEQAQGGVLFLDEVGELHPDVQKLLLRFLETRTFARVGSTTSTPVDIQIVCATNRSLESAIRERQFREDLFYRLQSFVIPVPSLNERPTDVPALIEHFLSLFRQQGRSRVTGITEEVCRRLERHHYPGNVRELKSIVERAMMWANARGHLLIAIDDLPAEVNGPTVGATKSVFGEDGINLDKTLALTALEYVEQALQSAEGRKSKAWKLLGLKNRFVLWRRIKRIAQTYPGLLERFPLVQELYGTERDM